MRFLGKLLVLLFACGLSFYVLKALGLRSAWGKFVSQRVFDDSSSVDDIQNVPLIDTVDVVRQINRDVSLPFTIRVNRAQNRVVIYGMDYNGKYSIPYRGFICSTGRQGCDTPLGVFTISDKYLWRKMVDGSYAQFAMRVHGGILIHSVPYHSASKSDLETDEYNKLGSYASLGCIRLCVSDVKWIYDNCPSGTTVVIYDSENETMTIDFECPEKIASDSPYSGWDPTDPDVGNPWKLNDI